MTGYALHCTVCKIDYWRRQDWNRHLIGKGHQERAKLEVNQWTDEVRKCCVLLYSSFPLVNYSSVNMVIQYFSSKGSRLVTDFLLSDRRPRNAILQFESKMKVKELFSETGGPSIRIEDQLVQFKTLGTVLELEWKEILLDFVDPGLQPYSPVLSMAGSPENCPSVLPEMPKPSHGNNDINCTNNVGLGQQSALCRELQSIYQEMEVPDDEFNLATEVILEMKKVLEDSIPGCGVAFYRHNFLKLRNNPKSNTYLILISKDEHTGFGEISKDMMDPLEKYLRSEDNQNSILNKLRILPNRDDSDGQPGLGTRLYHPKSKVSLRYSSCYRMAGELQLSRLVAYYCNFDPRVKPLLALLYFWAKLNNIRVGKSYTVSLKATRCSPDPTALEWLLLVFLFKVKKIIPVPSEIFERRLKDKWVETRAWISDIRFNNDIKFCEEWKQNQNNVPDENSEAFALSVVELLKEFFGFCCTGLSTHVIVVTREGKIVNLVGNGRKSNILIGNPFVKNCRLLVDNVKWKNEVLPGMRITCRKLGSFLESLDLNESISRGLLRKALCIK